MLGWVTPRQTLMTAAAGHFPQPSPQRTHGPDEGRQQDEPDRGREGHEQEAQEGEGKGEDVAPEQRLRPRRHVAVECHRAEEAAGADDGKDDAQRLAAVAEGLHGRHLRVSHIDNVHRPPAAAMKNKT